jgi:hypothetical protein
MGKQGYQGADKARSFYLFNRQDAKYAKKERKKERKKSLREFLRNANCRDNILRRASHMSCPYAPYLWVCSKQSFNFSASTCT